MKLHESTSVRRDPCALTPREREALILMAAHGNYHDAAVAAGVGDVTMRERFATIRQKLGVKTNVEALEAAGMGETNGPA